MASKQKIDINSSGSKQCLLLGGLFSGLGLGRLPDGKAEGNLVDEVGKVVHQIGRGIVPLALQESEEISKRVDAPASSDDEAHGVECILHMATHFCHAGILHHKDLSQPM